MSSSSSPLLMRISNGPAFAERKSPRAADQAACSKLPSRPRPRPPSLSPTLVRPPQSSRTESGPKSPNSQTLQALLRQLQRLCVPVQADQASGGLLRTCQRQQPLRRWPPNVRRLPAWRLRRFRPALCPAIPAPLPTAPACVVHPILFACPAPFAPGNNRTTTANHFDNCSETLTAPGFQCQIVLIRVRFALQLIENPWYGS